MKFAVLGAGSAGHGIAGYLGLKGHDIFMYNRTPERIQALSETHTLKVSGIMEGAVNIQVVSDNIAKVVPRSPYILVTSRAGGHYQLIGKSLPYLEDNAVIFVFTGYWAGLRLQPLLKKYNRTDITVVETTLLPLACRVVTPGHVLISGEKSSVRMAVYPPERASALYEKLHSVFPQIFLGESTMETSLENYNPVIHIPIGLFNLRHIEQDPETFNFYSEGISPKVAAVVDAVDSERIRLCEALSLDLMSAPSMIRDYYNVQGKTTYKTIKNWEAVREYVLPDPFSYIREELRYGLVPLASLCTKFDIPAPAATMLIDAWSLIEQVPYSHQGVTLDTLGINTLSKEEIVEVAHGRKIHV